MSATARERSATGQHTHPHPFGAVRAVQARLWACLATAVLVGYAQECRTRKRLHRAAMLRRLTGGVG